MVMGLGSSVVVRAIYRLGRSVAAVAGPNSQRTWPQERAVIFIRLYIYMYIEALWIRFIVLLFACQLLSLWQTERQKWSGSSKQSPKIARSLP